MIDNYSFHVFFNCPFDDEYQVYMAKHYFAIPGLSNPYHVIDKRHITPKIKLVIVEMKKYVLNIL